MLGQFLRRDGNTRDEIRHAGALICHAVWGNPFHRTFQNGRGAGRRMGKPDGSRHTDAHRININRRNLRFHHQSFFLRHDGGNLGTSRDYPTAC